MHQSLPTALILLLLVVSTLVAGQAVANVPCAQTCVNEASEANCLYSCFCTNNALRTSVAECMHSRCSEEDHITALKGLEEYCDAFDTPLPASIAAIIMEGGTGPTAAVFSPSSTLPTPTPTPTPTPMTSTMYSSSSRTSLAPSSTHASSTSTSPTPLLASSTSGQDSTSGSSNGGSGSGEGLSSGAIAAITIASFVVAVLGVIANWMVFIRKKEKPKDEKAAFRHEFQPV